MPRGSGANLNKCHAVAGPTLGAVPFFCGVLTVGRLKKLLNRQAALLDRLKEISARCDAANEDPTDEERAEREKIEAELSELEKEIEYEQRLHDREQKLSGRPDANQKAEEAAQKDAEKSKESQGWATRAEFLGAIVRAGRDRERDPRLVPAAASGLNEEVPSEGGYLVEYQMANEILEQSFNLATLANRCRSIPIGPNANGLKINAVDQTSRANGSRWGGVRAYWAHEGDTVSASQPKFRRIQMELEKLMALVYVTEELLADSTALESFMGRALADEFSFLIDDAIFEGSGAGQPLGLTTNTDLMVTVAKESGQAANTIVVANLAKMRARMWPRGHANAAWLINPDVESQLYTLTLGDQPVYLAGGRVNDEPFGRLFGRPVLPIEFAETLGTLNDIVYADLSQYLLIRKGGLKPAMSMHVRFIYDEMTFRWTLRINGQPMWHKAVTPFKGSNTLSPFVNLATRS